MDHQRATSADDGSLGTDRTWATQNASVKVALWSAGSTLVKDFFRGDIVGDFVIATDTDLSARSKDRFLDGSVYYRVNAWQKFSNAAVSSESLFLYDCSRRT